MPLYYPTFGSGPPVVATAISEPYFDTSTSPFTQYVYEAGAWHITGSAGDGGITQLTGDVTAGPGNGSQAATIANGAVTYAKMQNAGATTLLGNPTGGAHALEEITLGTNLSFAGSVLNAAGSGSGITITDGSTTVTDATQITFTGATVGGTTPDATVTVNAVGANPTATAGPAAVNGSAATFMRSDAAPAIQKASNSVFGIVEVDGTTITAAAGVISSAAGAGTVSTQAGTTYTFALGDAGNYIQFTSGSSVTATIPLFASVAYPVGTVLTCEQNGAGTVTIAATGGVTLVSNGSKVATNGQYAVVSLKNTASDTWTLFGNLA